MKNSEFYALKSMVIESKEDSLKKYGRFPESVEPLLVENPNVSTAFLMSYVDDYNGVYNASIVPFTRFFLHADINDYVRRLYLKKILCFKLSPEQEKELKILEEKHNFRLLFMQLKNVGHVSGESFDYILKEMPERLWMLVQGTQDALSVPLLEYFFLNGNDAQICRYLEILLKKSEYGQPTRWISKDVEKKFLTRTDCPEAIDKYKGYRAVCRFDKIKRKFFG